MALLLKVCLKDMLFLAIRTLHACKVKMTYQEKSVKMPGILSYKYSETAKRGFEKMVAIFNVLLPDVLLSRLRCLSKNCRVDVTKIKMLTTADSLAGNSIIDVECVVQFQN